MQVQLQGHQTRHSPQVPQACTSTPLVRRVGSADWRENHLNARQVFYPMYDGTTVQLRPLERKHLPRCVEWLNDPEVAENLSIYEPVSMEGEQRWYDDLLRDRSSKVFALETREGVHLGNVGFHEIDLHNRKAELGIFIGEKGQWGKGYGEEGVRLALRFAFEGMNLNRVYLRTFASNVRAQKCYEKVGFVKEGALRQEMFKNGTYVDCFVYSILAEEYFKKS